VSWFESWLSSNRAPLAALAPSAVEACARRALAAFHAGRYAIAERELDHAVRLPGAPHALRYYRARVFQRSGRIAEALAELERARDCGPACCESSLLEAVCLAEAGEGVRARAALERARVLGFPLPSRPPRAGGAPAPEGLAEAARAVAECPEYADRRLRYAVRLEDAGALEEAAAQVALALALNPGYLEARLGAARLALERGEPSVAIAHLEEAARLRPTYPDVHFLLALAYSRGEHWGNAQAAAERAVELNRHFGRAQRLLGLALHARGHDQDALRAVRRGLVRDRELAPAAERSHPAAWAARPADPERSLALQPDYPDLHVALARARRAAGALESARDAYRTALRLCPDYAEAALELAMIEMDDGRVGAGVTLLEDVVRRRPDWRDAHRLLVRARRAAARPCAASAELTTPEGPVGDVLPS
jgi:tetratricopeptide (TPR) repeat protein